MDARRLLLSILLVVSVLSVSPAVASESDGAEASEAEKPVAASITGELGFLDVLSHKIQFSRDGSEIDYVEEGGQDVLFRFVRISAEFEFGDRHHAELLYQPLNLESRVRLDRPLKIDGATFPKDRAVNMRFKFPFYRASYLYDFASDGEREIAAGLGLQLRNATIDFTTVDGELRRTNRNVGPVPLLGFRTHLPIGGTYWFEFEADGFYAPVSYINGDDNDVVGAILDSSIRAGRPLTPHVDGFVNLRYLGGGSEGEDPDDEGPGDGYTRDWLHFATVSLGFTWGTEK